MKYKVDTYRIISTAPGRVCLFGDHQDYLGLPVIACAINKYIELEAVQNDLNVFRIKMPDIGQYREIDINDAFDVLNKRDYFASSLRVVRRYGYIPNKGYDLTITGDLAINSGLSSSSALIVAWVQFLMHVFGAGKKNIPDLISQIAYEAEVLEHKESGGKMDQYSIGIGNILHINMSQDFDYTVIGKSLDGLIIGESGIPKDTVGLLVQKKNMAKKAIDVIKQHEPDFNLKTITLEQYDNYTEYLSEDLQVYFHAAVKNHSITKKALIEFEKEDRDLNRIGLLMTEHHIVLKDQLKITVPLIDDMIEASLKAGASGAKIVGSGGGGCIVAIAPPGKKDEIIQVMLSVGAKAAYEVNVDSGVNIKPRKT